MAERSSTNRRKFESTLGSFVLRILVKGQVFSVTCPREGQKSPDGRTSIDFSFLFTNEDDKFEVLVRASEILLEENAKKVNLGPALLRAAKSTIEKGETTIGVGSSEIQRYLSDSLSQLTDDELRNSMKEYVWSRYNIAFDFPFSVIELVVGLNSTTSRIVRGLHYLHKHEYLSFPWAPSIWQNYSNVNEWLKHEFTITDLNYEKLKKEESEFILPVTTREITEDTKEKDFFICHASEDKKEVAKPLALALSRLGAKVWYDEWSLKIGDSLSTKIDQGLRNSRFGIVIISSSFFGKRWPEKELDALVQKEINGEDVILPIWHKVDYKFVASKSLLLASKVAGTTSKGIDALAKQIVQERLDTGNARLETVMNSESAEGLQGSTARASKTTNKPAPAQVHISYSDIELSENAHSYNLVVELSLFTPPDQGRIRLKLLWPFTVPILKEENVRCTVRDITNGVVQSRELVVNYEDRIFSGETVQLVGPNSPHRIQYSFDQDVLNEIESKETLLRYSVLFEDHHAIQGDIEFRELNKF